MDFIGINKFSNNQSSGLISLIDLKNEYTELSKSLRNKQSYNANLGTFDALKRLDSLHHKKCIQFKNRVEFFENYLANDFSKKKLSIRMAHASRAAGEELALEIKNGQHVIQTLINQKENLSKQLRKYFKFFKFIQDTIPLFDQCQDVSQIVSRYQSLVLMSDEIVELLEENTDKIFSLRTDLFKLVRNHDDDTFKVYELKLNTEEELIRVKQRVYELVQSKDSNYAFQIEKVTTNEKILKAIDNMYYTSNKYKKFSLHKLKYNQVPKLIDEDKTEEKKNLYFSDILLRLEIIKKNLIYLKEIVEF